MPRPGGSGPVPCAGARRALATPGPLIFVPGAPQWLWGQRERALTLGVAFASAMTVGLFAWGTAAGWVMLGFAYLMHVASAADAIRQWAFPGFGPWVPTASASTALGVGLYGPLAVLAALMAWPGMEEGGRRSGVLVDRLAYRGHPARPGDRVWLGSGSGGRLAEVIAGSGEEVDWAGGRARIGGRRVDLFPFRAGAAPVRLGFRVPDGHLLVSYESDDPLCRLAWEVVPEGRVEGRAWARFYPTWERRLLN